MRVAVREETGAKGGEKGVLEKIAPKQEQPGSHFCLLQNIHQQKHNLTLGHSASLCWPFSWL